jgi:hypothetical protein
MSPMPMSEADFQTRVIDLALLYGCLVFHDVDSRRNRAGFPDLVIVGTEVLFVELKAEDGKLRHEQQTWLNSLRIAGARVAVWRPSDWGEVQQVLKSVRVTR